MYVDWRQGHAKDVMGLNGMLLGRSVKVNEVDAEAIILTPILVANPSETTL